MSEQPKGVQAKMEGMAAAARKRVLLLEAARKVAMDLAGRHPQGETDADEVRLHMNSRLRAIGSQYRYEDLGPAAGSIFAQKCWVFTGERRLSTLESNHAREIKRWRYRGA